jgi:hypothetical protein
VSTTVVAQLTGEAGTDLHYEEFAVITVREDVERDTLDKVTRRVSQDDYAHDGDVDEVELRASLASELKAQGLTLERLEIVPWVWFGE